MDQCCISILTGLYKVTTNGGTCFHRTDTVKIIFCKDAKVMFMVRNPCTCKHCDNTILSRHAPVTFVTTLSTITQLIEVYDQLSKAVSQGKEVRIVFLDISKAFDRVWHKGLIYKLRKVGINGPLLKWLENYLTDRQQRSLVNGQFSSLADILAGVPQGSVLGPLLFLIFINDIMQVIKHCEIRLFADDTCLFIEVNNPYEAAKKLTMT